MQQLLVRKKSVISLPEGLNKIVLTSDTVNMNTLIILIIQTACYFFYHMLSAQGRSETGFKIKVPVLYDIQYGLKNKL